MLKTMAETMHRVTGFDPSKLFNIQPFIPATDQRAIERSPTKF